jgi:hypothetical protein
MSTVLFKRSANINEIPIVDGQLVFDETHNKIYMDNGTERLQYGGDVSLIEDTSYATSNNTFSANGSLNLFTQKLSVIDNKDSALAVTEQHVPVGCLAFQSVIGNADYSGVGNTISDSLVTLKNNITNINGQLVANENTMYMDYHDGKYGVNTSPTRGADTFIPFNDGKVYVHSGGSSVTFTSPVSGQIYCYLTSVANEIAWYGEASVSITNNLSINGTVVCNCSGSNGDGSRHAGVRKTNSYSGTVNEGDTITITRGGNGNYGNDGTHTIVIVDGSILSPT